MLFDIDDLNTRAPLPAPPPTELKLDLLENGIDYLRVGIGHFFPKDENDARTYKYAVINLFAGVVLILKERLRRVDESLIYATAHDADAGADGRTVNVHQLLERLNKAGIVLSRENDQLLRQAAKLRNRLEHAQCDLDLKRTQEILGQLCELAYWFLRDQLFVDLEASLDADTAEQVTSLRGIGERIAREHKEDWLRRATPFMNLTEEQLRAMVDDVEPYHPRHNPDPVELRECPECKHESVLMKHADIGVCTNPECASVLAADECLRCSAPIFSGVLCETCNDYLERY